jgi:hypothetical protein
MEVIDTFLNNSKIVYFICFLLAIYISFIQNRLTENQVKFFQNDYVRIIYLFIIIFIFTKNNIIGVLLTITYLTMSSSMISEDFYVSENFFEYTPDQISNMLKDPHEICKNGRHQRLCSKINQNYKLIEDSTKRILNTCNNLKKNKKNPPKQNNFINQQQKYDIFKLDNKKSNDFNKILQI